MDMREKWDNVGAVVRHISNHCYRAMCMNNTPFFWEFFFWRLYRFIHHEELCALISNRNNAVWHYRVDYMHALGCPYKQLPDLHRDVKLNREYEVACELALPADVVSEVLSYL